MTTVICYSCTRFYDPSIPAQRQMHMSHADSGAAPREVLLGLLDQCQEERDELVLRGGETQGGSQ